MSFELGAKTGVGAGSKYGSEEFCKNEVFFYTMSIYCIREQNLGPSYPAPIPPPFLSIVRLYNSDANGIVHCRPMRQRMFNFWTIHTQGFTLKKALSWLE